MNKLNQRHWPFMKLAGVLGGHSRPAGTIQKVLDADLADKAGPTPRSRRTEPHPVLIGGDGIPQEQQQPMAQRAALQLGGVCVIIGSLAVAGFRLAHGDPPAAIAEAHLHFILQHPAYAGVHLGTIFGVLVWMVGFMTLLGTLAHPFAQLVGRFGLASVLVGAAIFIVDFTIDGVAGQDLARAWAAAPPAAQADLVLAAETAATMLRGTSLTSIILLWGLPLMLFGRALLWEGYPRWLGWSGVATGATTGLAATALLLHPDRFPGVLVYGLLASILVQLWSVALGVVLWRRAVDGPQCLR